VDRVTVSPSVPESDAITVRHVTIRHAEHARIAFTRKRGKEVVRIDFLAWNN